MGTLLVAETNEHGEVRAVWCKRPSFKAARPVQARHEAADVIADAEYWGASESAIRRFLRALP